VQRVTITIDDELLEALDRHMEAGGHENRSEAIRDLVRTGLFKETVSDDPNRNCVAALVYVYDHETRQLAKKLVHDHHAHADMSVATLHVHIDAESCLEVSLLKGPKGEIEHFAGHLIGEKGVRYGQLVVVPASSHESAENSHSHEAHTHSHS
jgi:CopG family nickel-responsive transcriptional regulator